MGAEIRAQGTRETVKQAVREADRAEVEASVGDALSLVCSMRYWWVTKTKPTAMRSSADIYGRPSATPAAKNSSLISTGTQCSCNLSAARTPSPRSMYTIRRAGDVRYCAHNGLKSDVAPCPISAFT